MTSDLHSRLLAHGIAVVGNVDLPADEAHARLREALRMRHPAGMASDVFWRRENPAELHYSDEGVRAAIRSECAAAGSPA